MRGYSPRGTKKAVWIPPHKLLPNCCALIWWIFFIYFQYVEDPTFDRHGLTPVTVLNQAMSGLAHLHSLNIGKNNFFSQWGFVLIKINFIKEGNSPEGDRDFHTIYPMDSFHTLNSKIPDDFNFGVNVFENWPFEIFEPNIYSTVENFDIASARPQR